MFPFKLAGVLYGLPFALLILDITVGIRPDVLGVPTSKLSPSDYRGIVGWWLVVGWFFMLGIGIWYRAERELRWTADVVVLTFVLVASTAAGVLILQRHARPQMDLIAHKAVKNITGPNSYVEEQERKARTATGSIRKKDTEDSAFGKWWKENINPGQSE